MRVLPESLYEQSGKFCFIGGEGNRQMESPTDVLGGEAWDPIKVQVHFYFENCFVLISSYSPGCYS